MPSSTSKQWVATMSDVDLNPETPPTDVGELTLGEMRLLESLRANADALVREIGHLEVRKANTIVRLGQFEAQAQSLLGETAKRLGIPNGETWHVTPEGKVRRGHSNGG